MKITPVTTPMMYGYTRNTAKNNTNSPAFKGDDEGFGFDLAAMNRDLYRQITGRSFDAPDPREILNNNCKAMGIECWDDIERTSAVQCSHFLKNLVLPALKDNKPESLCDLGCAGGAVTNLIGMALNIAPDNIVGVEKGGNCGYRGNNYVNADAIDYLKTTDKKFDMISVCMPESLVFDSRSLFNINPQELFKTAPKKLNDGGYLFIYAEKTGKMNELEDELSRNNIRFEKCEYDSTILPFAHYSSDLTLAILVPKEELEKLYSNPI